MRIPNIYKIFVIIALLVLVVSLLPRVALVWAEANPTSVGFSTAPPPLLPPAQGGETEDEGVVVRPAPSYDDMIVRFGDEPGDISGQSDNSGVEIVPAAAFIHTDFTGVNPAEAWFYDFGFGILTNDSATDTVCMVAPVYLPLDSQIDSFTAYLYDGDPGVNNDFDVFLDRTSVLGDWVELAAVGTTGSSGAIQVLTDPSITTGAEVVSAGYNYHVDLCLPADTFYFMVVLGARIDYSTATVLTSYLPVLLKNHTPAPPQTTLSIKNEIGAGGVVNEYTILGTPQGNITCPVPINNGATANCLPVPFDSGTYTVQVNFSGPGCGGAASGALLIPPGNCTRVVACGGTPATWSCTQ